MYSFSVYRINLVIVINPILNCQNKAINDICNKEDANIQYICNKEEANMTCICNKAYPNSLDTCNKEGVIYWIGILNPIKMKQSVINTYSI